MSNLQALHDFYLATKPNTGKVQQASNLLIRLCKHLELDTPEDITQELFQELPNIIDIYYRKDFHKAIQDKSMLAEMIGRYGPRNGWEKALETLLEDDDVNLRQFSFQALEFSARNRPEDVIPYIKRYVEGDDPVLMAVAARIVSKIISSENENLFISLIEEWNKNNKFEFLEELKKHTLKCIKRKEDFARDEFYLTVFEKLDGLLQKK